MRIKNSLRNGSFAVINFVLKFALQFALRTIFIKYLSESYLGLNSLFSNILSVLSLAELGVGASIVFSMYKPAAENNIQKINALIKLYKKFYFIIGLIITLVGIGLLPFLEYFIDDTSVVAGVNLKLVFLVFLASTVFAYVNAHKRAIIYVNQRADIESKIGITLFCLISVFEILIIVLTKNYMIYIIIKPIGVLAEGFIIAFIANRKYPHIKERAGEVDKETKKEITKNVGALIFHKIGGVVVFSTDSILISSFLGLSILGLYSNYLMFITAMYSFFAVFNSAVRSSVGNMIASESIDEVYKLYSSFNIFNYWFSGFCAICFIVLAQPFMNIWLGDTYLLSDLEIIFMGISFYVTQNRAINNMFKETAGLFYQDRLKPIFESLANLVISLLLLQILGLAGIIWGTICSTLMTCMWVEPYVLHKQTFKKNIKRYLAIYAFFALFAGLIGTAIYFICTLIKGNLLIAIALKLTICIIMINLAYLLILFRTQSFKFLLKKLKGVFTKKKEI